MIITDLSDVTLIATPVTISQYGRADRIEHRHRAQLFKAENRAAYRPATLVRNAYGDPLVETGRLVSVLVSPRPAGGRSPWELSIWTIPPGERQPIGCNRDFPADPVLLMWGAQDISLSGLPPLTAPLRWHCTNFGAIWREVAHRCRVTGAIWLDTTVAAIASQAQRHQEHSA